MVQVLIVGLVIALLVMIGLFIYQRQTLKKLTTVKTQLADLPTARIERELSKDRVASLMGESLKSFTELRTRYDEKLHPRQKELLDLADQLAADAKTTALFSMGEDVKGLQADTESLVNSFNKIMAAINKLAQDVQTQEAALTKLRKTYNEYSKTLDVNAFQFGASKEKLLDCLVKLQEKFERFAKIANQGDHEAAQEILDELQDETADFAHLMKEVPDLYKPLYATFPDQLTELKSGYEELTDEHYRFTDPDLEKQIIDLSELQKQALEQLADLDLAPVKAAVDHMAPAIDHLYEVMQTELDARPQVQKRLPLVTDQLEKTQQNNRQLLNQLEKLSISYTLNHNELADARGLTEQLRQAKQTLDEDKSGLDEHTAIDSVVLEHLIKLRQELEAIEKQQVEISQGVSTLQKDEERAQLALQRFAMDLKATKRQVTNLNLPGIGQDYHDYFFVVSNEIKKLSRAMNQPQVNMEEVTKQLLVVQEDLQTLHEKTEQLRDSAELTGRLIQYAHRLSVDHEGMDEEIAKAEQLFKEFRYADSLEAIGSAVEEAEPGAFKRLEQTYYEENGIEK